MLFIRSSRGYGGEDDLGTNISYYLYINFLSKMMSPHNFPISYQTHIIDIHVDGHIRGLSVDSHIGGVLNF